MKPVKNFHGALRDIGYEFPVVTCDPLYIANTSSHTVWLDSEEKETILLFHILFDTETIRVEVAPIGGGLTGTPIHQVVFSRADVETPKRFLQKIEQLATKCHSDGSWY